MVGRQSATPIRHGLQTPKIRAHQAITESAVRRTTVRHPADLCSWSLLFPSFDEAYGRLILFSKVSIFV